MVLTIVVSIFVIVAFTGYIDAKFLRINDFFKPISIISALLQVLDLVSDVFTSVAIMERAMDKDIYLWLFLASLVFIIIPIIVSIGQLMHQINKHWMKDDKLKLWLTENSKILFVASIFCGSSFTAVKLMNSNLFQVYLFSIGLTKEQRNRYMTKSVYSVVIFEVLCIFFLYCAFPCFYAVYIQINIFIQNIPQMILQTIYMIEIGNLQPIPISSLIFSFISIITTIISMRSTKNILDSSGFAIIQFDVTGPSILVKAKKYMTRTAKIRQNLALFLGLPDKRFIEMLRPENIPNGLRVRAIIHINRITARDIDYKKLLNESHSNGQLQDILKRSWSLEDDFVITKFMFTVKESKQWISEQVSIKMNTNLTNHHLQNKHNKYSHERLESGEMEENSDIELAPVPQVNINNTTTTGNIN